MADPKQDKSKEKKEPNSEGVGFKTVMGGFDKNEVNLYINKLKRQMKEQQLELEKRIENLQTNLEDANKEATKAKSEKKDAEAAAAAASAPVIKDSSAETKKLIDDLKAESDKKIMELRKSILDERRNVAKFDKECAMAKMSEKKVREEYEKLKTKYLELKKKGGGGPAPKPITTSNADEVMDEASRYAKELIAEAKKYADETVKAANQYKSDVEAELKARADKLTEIKNKLDAQIKKTNDDQAESAKKLRDMTKKIGALTVLFDSFAGQFGSVNDQISSVTGKIDDICKQFNDTTSQFSNVAKQINDTTSKIDTVSKQISETTTQIDSFSKTINETTSQINGFAKSINETTDKINAASKQMAETTGKITETSKQMNETSKQMNDTTGQINEATKKMNGFTDQLNSAKSEIGNITKLVDSTSISFAGAKAEVAGAQSATATQANATDLSPFAKIGAEITSAVGAIKAELKLPTFDEKKFDPAKFDALKKKLKIETTYEESGVDTSSAFDDDDEFDDNDIISSIEIDSPEVDIPSDEDLMADVPDVITAPVFEDSDKPAKSKAPEKKQPDKTDRPGLDSDFEDFFMTPPKDDDMSGDIPLINMEGVGVDENFTLDQKPEHVGHDDFDITPIDKTAKPEKGDDLGADIFDIAIDPSGTDDNTLAEMMADAAAAEKAANKDLTTEDLGSSDDFGEFADLFAAGSAQTTAEHTKSKPAFRQKPSDDPWNFGSEDSSGDDSDLSADSDLADLFV